MSLRTRSEALFQACRACDYDRAQALRLSFLPLENLRDQWGPARVLHAAVEIAGIANTGPIPPYQSALPVEHHEALREALQAFENYAAKVAG